MASSSEGSREIEAAKKRLAAAKERASADAKALKSAREAEAFARDAEASARKMAEMAKKNADAIEKHRGDIESQLQGSKEEMEEAETFLKGAEKRWEVVAIDDSDVDESEEGGSRKKQKTSSSDRVDEITVEGCGVPGANGVYKATSIRGRVVYVKEGELEGKEGKFIIYSYEEESWYCSHSHHEGRRIETDLYYSHNGETRHPPKDCWMVYARRRKYEPAPTLKW